MTRTNLVSAPKKLLPSSWSQTLLEALGDQKNYFDLQKTWHHKLKEHLPNLDCEEQIKSALNSSTLLPTGTILLSDLWQKDLTKIAFAVQSLMRIIKVISAPLVITHLYQINAQLEVKDFITSNWKQIRQLIGKYLPLLVSWLESSEVQIEYHCNLFQCILYMPSKLQTVIMLNYQGKLASLLSQLINTQVLLTDIITIKQRAVDFTIQLPPFLLNEVKPLAGSRTLDWDQVQNYVLESLAWERLRDQYDSKQLQQSKFLTEIIGAITAINPADPVHYILKLRPSSYSKEEFLELVKSSGLMLDYVLSYLLDKTIVINLQETITEDDIPHYVDKEERSILNPGLFSYIDYSLLNTKHSWGQITYFLSKHVSHFKYKIIMQHMTCRQKGHDLLVSIAPQTNLSSTELECIAASRYITHLLNAVCWHYYRYRNQEPLRLHCILDFHTYKELHEKYSPITLDQPLNSQNLDHFISVLKNVNDPLLRDLLQNIEHYHLHNRYRLEITIAASVEPDIIQFHNRKGYLEGAFNCLIGAKHDACEVYVTQVGSRNLPVKILTKHDLLCLFCSSEYISLFKEATISFKQEREIYYYKCKLSPESFSLYERAKDIIDDTITRTLEWYGLNYSKFLWQASSKVRKYSEKAYISDAEDPNQLSLAYRNRMLRYIKYNEKIYHED